MRNATSTCTTKWTFYGKAGFFYIKHHKTMKTQRSGKNFKFSGNVTASFCFCAFRKSGSFHFSFPPPWDAHFSAFNSAFFIWVFRDSLGVLGVFWEFQAVICWPSACISRTSSSPAPCWVPVRCLCLCASSSWWVLRNPAIPRRWRDPDSGDVIWDFLGGTALGKNRKWL